LPYEATKISTQQQLSNNCTGYTYYIFVNALFDRCHIMGCFAVQELKSPAASEAQELPTFITKIV
jgi:hypothetical protein